MTYYAIGPLGGEPRIYAEASEMSLVHAQMEAGEGLVATTTDKDGLPVKITIPSDAGDNK